MTLRVYTFHWSPDWDRLLPFVIPRLQHYCDKHGYELTVDKTPHESSWAKIMWARKTIISKCQSKEDLLWLLDLDTLITNPNIPVHQFANGPEDLFVTKDINCLNGGSMLVRATHTALDVLDFMIAGKDRFDTESTWLRAAEQMLLEGKYLKILPQHTINSYMYGEYGDHGRIQYMHERDSSRDDRLPTHEEGNWEPGDLLVHMPGMNNDKRVEIMRRLTA